MIGVSGLTRGGGTDFPTLQRSAVLPDWPPNSQTDVCSDLSNLWTDIQSENKTNTRIVPDVKPSRQGNGGARLLKQLPPTQESSLSAYVEKGENLSLGCAEQLC